MDVHYVRTRPILQEMQNVWMNLVNQTYQLQMECRESSSRCMYIRVPFSIAVSPMCKIILQSTPLLIESKYAFTTCSHIYIYVQNNHIPCRLETTKPGNTCEALHSAGPDVCDWNCDRSKQLEMPNCIDQSKPEKSADFNVPVDSVHEVGMHSLMLHSDCTEERGCLVHFLRLLAVWWPGAQSARDKVSK